MTPILKTQACTVSSHAVSCPLPHLFTFDRSLVEKILSSLMFLRAMDLKLFSPCILNTFLTDLRNIVCQKKKRSSDDINKHKAIEFVTDEEKRKGRKRCYAPSATLGSSGELKGMRKAEERKQRILAKQWMHTEFFFKWRHCYSLKDLKKVRILQILKQFLYMEAIETIWFTVTLKTYQQHASFAICRRSTLWVISTL